MAAQATLLAAMLQDRNVYESFQKHGSADLFTGLRAQLYSAIQGYYGIDGAIQHCDRDTVRERAYKFLPNPKHQAALDSLMRDLPEGVSVANVLNDILTAKRERAAGELSVALTNRSSQDTVERLIDEYRSVSLGHGDSQTDKESELIDVLDTKDLTSEVQYNDYIKLYPKSLNDRLDGGALRGHHVLVFARPECGKTLFAINLAYGFLRQKLSVLYVGNEEPAADIRDRLRGRILGTSKQAIRNSPGDSANRLAAVKGELSIIESTSFQDVRACLVRSSGAGSYGVVILDQVRNMRLKSDSRTAELEAAGIEARAIAKEYGVLVVSITQAGDSASNKVYLTMSDVDSSKTGLPASCDLMIGLGGNEEMKATGSLGVSLCKNKLSGLHDRFIVQANFATGVIV